ncbi:MAG: STAS/SEC14 domain-containing protein [Acidobacteriota bacterium]
MVDFELDTAHSILYLRPTSELAADDFAKIASVVDPHIEATGDLAGIVLEVSSFPGWEGFGALAAHFRFVRDHHRRVKKIAVITDSPLGSVAEHLASHFVSAEIRSFPSGETEAAKQWILGAQ